MPLPKSVLCSSCKKTYPEGWKRCPYCGYSESAEKLEAQGRRFMQQKVREWEQRTGRPREERPRPGERSADRGQKQRPGRVRDQRRQRGGKPQQKAPPPTQGQRPPLPQQVQVQAQLQSAEGQRTGRRRRRRRGGGSDRPQQAASPNQPTPQGQQHPQQRPSREANAPNVPRDSAPRDGNTGPARESGEGERSRRRKRFRRRRRGGGGGESGPPAAPSGE